MTRRVQIAVIGKGTPDEALAPIAEERQIGFHVDGCVGGWFLPWVEQLGDPVPLWDFRVPGVTSISADLHKFGYAAKGASLLIWRSIENMRHQIFVATDFPGGIYASPTLLGTRPGKPERRVGAKAAQHRAIVARIGVFQPLRFQYV